MCRSSRRRPPWWRSGTAGASGRWPGSTCGVCRGGGQVARHEDVDRLHLVEEIQDYLHVGLQDRVLADAARLVERHVERVAAQFGKPQVWRTSASNTAALPPVIWAPITSLSFATSALSIPLGYEWGADVLPLHEKWFGRSRFQPTRRGAFERDRFLKESPRLVCVTDVPVRPTRRPPLPPRPHETDW